MQIIRALIIASASLLLCSADATDKFTTTLNPGCDPALCSNDTQLVYSRLRRANDSLHVFVTIGTGLGDLVISYVQSSDPQQMAHIDWDKLFSGDPMERAGALNFSNAMAPELAKFSLVFSNLIEYSDVIDSVDMSKLVQNSTYFAVYPFSSFLWGVQLQPTQANDVTLLVLTANSSAAAFNDLNEYDSPATKPPPPSAANIFQSGGYLELRVLLSPAPGRADALPKLQFTGNNAQVELLMHHLSGGLASARFAVEAALLDGGQTAGVSRPQKIDIVKNIDDEYTPGVFLMTNWLSVLPQGGTACYAQWKPVCYTADTRTIGDSTVVTQSSLTNMSAGLEAALNASFAYTLYGGRVASIGVWALNVTFGMSKDNFYAATNYTLWTVSLGMGNPPSDAVSSLVIIVILCGLGLPALLMSAAAVYLCVRRFRHPDASASAYQPINA